VRYCWKRVIKDLKTYYNFYTDSFFTFQSHIYSDWENSISLEGSFKDVEVLVEIKKFPAVEEDVVETEEINFKSLLSKRKKIYLNLASSLGSEKQPDNKPNIKNDSKRTERVNYCHSPKAKCSKCDQKKNYTLIEINQLKYKNVINELKLHKHPTTRIIEKKQRNRLQAICELTDHYLTRH